tara:strand:+ start:577 stop:1977 length:1401 start_codon:yes stop_codon:yes gene_type:complete
MAIKSLKHSSLTDNAFYRSVLAGNSPPVAQGYYFGISDFATTTRSAIAFTANNRLVGYASDGPSGDVGTIVQLDGAGTVLAKKDIRANVGGGNNSSRVVLANTISGTDYLGVEEESTGNTDATFVKLASDGSIDWQRRLSLGTGSSNNVRCQDVTADSSGNVYGLALDQAGGSVEIAKWNSSGVVQWQKKYTMSGTGSLGGANGGLSLDSSGNLYMYLDCKDVASGYDDKTSVNKLSSTDGTITWTKYYQYTNDSSITTGVVDSSGNSYVTSRAQSGPGTFDNWGLPIVKYNSSGVFQWEVNMVYSTTTAMSSKPTKPVIDSSGNAIVCAVVGDGLDGLAIYSVSPTGSINWQRTLDFTTGSARPVLGTESSLNIVDDNVHLGFGWSDGNVEQMSFVFPADGSFTGTYTNGSTTVVVSASSLYNYSAFSQFTPTNAITASSSAFTEGAGALALFDRTYTLDLLELT